jgi:hypothetical protein
MNEVDWQVEHDRFMTLVYPRTLKAAKRAFSGWHISKQTDAVASCIGKMWCQWSLLLLRGRDPEPMIAGLIRHALLFVKYDRKPSIVDRARTPDVYDFRSGFKRQMLSEQGEASPTDRSDAANPWINWHVQAGDSPCELAAALEETNVTLAQWYDS